MEIAVKDVDLFNTIMNQAKVGYLGVITPDGLPRVIPVNFAYDGKQVFIHGAQHGEKYELFKKRGQVAMSADFAYSYIPSYWASDEYACSATMYYKSVHLIGESAIVTDADEKAYGLNALMRKYQPEGNYRIFAADDAEHESPLENVAILTIKPESATVRQSMGEQKDNYTRQQIVKHLEERGSDIDKITAAELRRMLG